MARKDLSLNPQIVNENVWYYEENDGIRIFHQTKEETYYFTVPWRKLRNSLKRKDKRLKGER